MPKIRLVSSDLNGTLVHQHTMSDMIKLYGKISDYEVANEAFNKQTNGQLSMQEAFAIAGPLTKGISLRQGIEYTRTHMQYVEGFKQFVDALHKARIPLVINSTGYSVTIYAIREQVGREKIHGHIGNSLKFGENGDIQSVLTEEELENLVVGYFTNGNSEAYDRIRSIGEVALGIVDEQAKADLIVGYAAKNLPQVSPNEIAHIGNSMGDSGGIIGIAGLGGMGIAFNFNYDLEMFLKQKLSSEKVSGEIAFITPKGEAPNLGDLLPLLI